MNPQGRRKADSGSADTVEPALRDPAPPAAGDGQSRSAEATLLLSLSRQLEAAHALIEDLQQRLEIQAVELYVARSDQQRSAVLADNLLARLNSAATHGSSMPPGSD